jgi:hypothetical protein
MQGVRIEPVSVAGCRGQELQAHEPRRQVVAGMSQIVKVKRHRCATPGPASAPRAQPWRGPPGRSRATPAQAADQFGSLGEQAGAAGRLPRRPIIPLAATRSRALPSVASHAIGCADPRLGGRSQVVAPIKEDGSRAGLLRLRLLAQDVAQILECLAHTGDELGDRPGHSEPGVLDRVLACRHVLIDPQLDGGRARQAQGPVRGEPGQRDWQGHVLASVARSRRSSQRPPRRGFPARRCR